MSKNATANLERFVTTEESDDNCDCADLADGFPCFECYLDGAEFAEEI